MIPFVAIHNLTIHNFFLSASRGDTPRLRRCTNIQTEGDDSIPRVKLLKYTYAQFKKLIYFSTECTFAPNAYRGHARKYLRHGKGSTIRYHGHNSFKYAVVCLSLSFVACDTKIEFICRWTIEQLRFKDIVKSQYVVPVIVLLEGLNRGLPKLGIGKKSKGNRIIAEQERELAIRERTQFVKNDF